MIMRFVLKIVASALALLAADLLITGFSVVGGLSAYAIGGLVLALLTTFVRPILRLFSLPFIWLTFGLFSLVINGFILWLASYFTGVILIEGFLPLLFATLIVTVVLSVLDVFSHND